jgi:hypothetical protein
MNGVLPESIRRMTGLWGLPSTAGFLRKTAGDRRLDDSDLNQDSDAPDSHALSSPVVV